MQQLTSLQNPNIKALQKLQSSKKERTEQGLFVAEGVRLAGEAATSGLVIEKLFCTSKALERYPEELLLLEQKAKESWLITEEIAKKIGDSVSPQGVFCLVRTLDNTATAVKIGNTGRLLLANHLQDPGNLGTIIRSCEAFGADGLIGP